MRLFLFACFLAIPLIEIGLFITVGDWIGLWPTLGLVLVTAVLGTALLRQQGLSTFMRAQAALERNTLPLKEIFDGICLLIAGAFLLTPGFLTDTLGLLLFIPAVREGLRNGLARLVGTGKVHVSGQAHTSSWSSPHHGTAPGGGAPRGGTIDGEWVDVTDSTDTNGPDGAEDRRPIASGKGSSSDPERS